MENNFSLIYNQSSNDNEVGIIARHKVKVILMYEVQREQFIEEFVGVLKKIRRKFTWTKVHLGNAIDGMFNDDVLNKIDTDYKHTKVTKETDRESIFFIDEYGDIQIEEESAQATIFCFFERFRSLLVFIYPHNKIKYNQMSIDYYGDIENVGEGHYFYSYLGELHRLTKYQGKKLNELIEPSSKDEIKMKGNRNSNFFGKLSKERAKIYLKAIELMNKKYNESQAFEIIAGERTDLDAMKLKKAFNKIKNDKFRGDPEEFYMYLKERSKSR